jgi:hypothetical protein
VPEYLVQVMTQSPDIHVTGTGAPAQDGADDRLITADAAAVLAFLHVMDHGGLLECQGEGTA